MKNKVVLAASVIALLICVGIASSQRRSAYAEGVTPIASATKGGDTGVIRHMAGTIVGIKRLSQEVIILTLDNGVIVQVNPSTSGELPIESISLNFTKIEFAYVNQSGDGRHVIAKSVRVLPSPTPTPTDVPIG